MMMRLFLIVFILPSFCSGQELILQSWEYLPDWDTTVTHIEFKQDSTRNFTASEKIYAVISKKEGYYSNYSIGLIENYQINQKEVFAWVTVYRFDGSNYTFAWNKKIKDLIQYKNYGHANYSIDVNFFYDTPQGEVHFN